MGLWDFFFGMSLNVEQRDNNIIIEGLYEHTLEHDMERSKYKNLLYLYTNELMTKGVFLHKLRFTTPAFYGLEMLWLFDDLYKVKHRAAYRDVYNMLLTKTWLRSLRTPEPQIDISRIQKFLKFPPRDYQVEFIRRYVLSKLRLQLNGAFLAFEQGLGKTYTALITALYIGNPVIVVISPLSLVNNWQDEIKSKLILPKYIIERVGMDTPTKHANFILASYERIKKLDDYIPEGVKVTVIIDESHNIRYMTTQRAQELIRFCKKYNINDIMALSGTPIKALAVELIPILHVLDDKFDNNAELVFRRIFRAYRPAAYSILRRRLSLMMHRELKEEVLTELPPKIEKDLYVHVHDSVRYTVPYLKQKVKEYVAARVPELNKDLHRHEKFLIKAFKEAYAAEIISRKDYKLAKHVITTIVGANIWAVSPTEYKYYKELYSKVRRYIGRVHGKDTAKYLDECKSGINVFMKALGEAIGRVYTRAKQNLVIDIIDDNIKLFIDMIMAAEKKTIFFSKFVKPVYHIAEKLNSYNVKCIPITGDVKPNELSEKLKLFAISNDYYALSATIGKLSTGVTITIANTVIFLDLPYRDADFRQAEDRVHRIGQDSTVYIYKVILDTGDVPNISRKTDEILLWSREMFEAVLGKEQKITKDVELQEILQLLNQLEG